MKLIYLAVPYTGMAPSGFYQVTRAMALILRKGKVNIFSPITHSYPLTQYEMPHEWEFWEKIDYDFLDRVNELYVLIPDEGVEKIIKSTGVNAEIEYAKTRGLTIKYVIYDRKSDDIVEVLPGTKGYESLNKFM